MQFCGLSIFHIAYLSEVGFKKEEVKYVQTESFANNYLYFFSNKISNCQENARDRYFDELEDAEGNKYYYFNNNIGYDQNQIEKYINYIIVEKGTGRLFTNIKSNNYQEVMEDIKNKEIYWNWNNKKIETNMTYINEDNIKYNHAYRNINYYGDDNKEVGLKDYDIYSYFDEEAASEGYNYLLNKNIYDFMLKNKQMPIYSCVLSLISLLIIAIYLFFSIGHKKGEEGISLNTMDKIPYEIVSIISLWIITFATALILNMFSNNVIMLIIYAISYFIGYIACAVLGVTTIKRIKAKTFWKSFLTYKIVKWMYTKIKKFILELEQKSSTNKKVFWYYWGFVVISIILGEFIRSGIALIALLIFWTWAFYRIRKYMRHQDEIKNALEKIYQGNNDVYIADDELEGTLKEMAVYINDIAGGFSNAIEESLKSERLKTELITNVSHDIKTPLTSIINYVDLLKKEDIKNEKIKEYIKILDMKSQRLKKLTEDLVEASKVSSGNVKLNIEEINVKELINQSIGEFKDRFEAKKLQIEVTMSEEEIKINADNRYLYRVIENLFSNITKYALDSSRVYIDVKKEKNKIEISMKNISKDRLNISSDELMQRFVRGDKSRYTEGSGLGLSIAKSLTELQGGSFDISIDGDLFKVVMEW